MIAKIVGVITALFGTRVFLSGIFMTIGAIVAYNLIVEVIEEVMNFAIAQMSGVDAGTIANPTLTGFAGWFLAQVRLPEAFAIMVTCVSLKFVLRKIPFLKW